MNNSQAVSKIENALNLLNKDDRKSRRYILRTLRDSAKNLIAQKLLDRTILQEENLYTEVRCIEFKKTEVIKCPIIEFRTCKTLMRSIKPLPELIFSRNGSSIRDITSIDGEYELTLTTPKKYRVDSKRKYRMSDEIYIYVGTDNHAYILDKEIQAVNLNCITIKTDEVGECSSCSNESCKSGWDYDFICPDKLWDTVFKDALQVLSGVTIARREDQNPNGIEGA